jgi:hypothetical protein
MFCTNCGSKIPDGSAFCDQCGAQQPVLQQQPNMAQQPVQPQVAPMKKPSKNVMIAVAAVVVVAIIAIVAIKSIKPKINLNDYVVVEFDGYDTRGTAKVSFDKEAFTAAYAKKIKFNGVLSESDRYELKNGSSYCDLLLEYCVDDDLDFDSRLSNGDTVTLVWDCDDEKALSEYGVKLSHEDTEYEVSGLKAVKEVDPFEDLTIEYSGISPSGYVNRITNNSTNEYIKDAYYYTNNGNNLSDGDEITVSVSLSWGEDYYLENYGVVFTSMEKNYTVEGLGNYVSSIDELTDDAITSMKKQAQDTLTAYAANTWRTGQVLGDMEYLGLYLLTPKSSDYSTDNNQVILVFKVTANDSIDDYNVYNESTYYYTTTFYNLVAMPDGTVTVDLTRYSTPNDNFSRVVQYGERSWEYYTYYYYGYETFDTMFNKSVTAKVEKYNYVSNVTQK